MTNLRLFLTRIYFKFAAGTFIAIAIFTALQTHYLAKSSIEQTKLKIENLVDFHKNELLNEVALDDQTALEQHLKTMLHEFNGESIELISDGIYIKEAPANHNTTKRILDTLVMWIYPCKALEISLANDFGDFKTSLRIHFASSSIQKEVIPFLINSSVLSLLILLSIFIWSWINYKVINDQIVVPLSEVAENLQSQNSQALDSLKDKQFTITEVNAFVNALSEYREYSALKKMSDIYAQLSHDIRSPLAALTVADKDLKLLPEHSRTMIRGAIARIRDIANHLLEKNRQAQAKTLENPPSETLKAEYLPGLLEAIMSEKRMQYSTRLNLTFDFHLGQESYGLFSSVNPEHFKRLVSNLVNNAAEAIRESGVVSVTLRSHNDFAVIDVKDTGCGIPPEILSKVFDKGLSYNKENGFGLGLYHARECVKEWGGKIEIFSKLDEGTHLEVSIPLSSPPYWFVDKIDATKEIVVVDDDPNIHNLWVSRFSTLKKGSRPQRVIHFSDLKEFQDWHKTAASSHTLFLVDYEFSNSNETGLDIIDSLAIHPQSILVTSRFEEPEVFARCEKHRLKLLPKACVGLVPLS
ncbi:MAG TPA: HAMP domain-containing sensor histidine kinase [Bdellovibrionota bacterium]|nr:HAMP domain-containing sensor histidine kinase [Bdellovibrionota bacterium]